VTTKRAIYRFLGLPLIIASGSFLAVKASPKVKLLIPVRDGLEFAQVSRLVVDARVFEEGEQAFVMVGAFDDAQVAYRLGATLQGRLKLPFELHYDPGHPQSDLAWTKSLARPTARSTAAAAASKPPGSPAVLPVMPLSPLQTSGGGALPRSQRIEASPASGSPATTTPVAAGALPSP
jgi:hypothetical protein